MRVRSVNAVAGMAGMSWRMSHDGGFDEPDQFCLENLVIIKFPQTMGRGGGGGSVLKCGTNSKKGDKCLQVRFGCFDVL